MREREHERSRKGGARERDIDRRERFKSTRKRKIQIKKRIN